tara:strand:+ start:7725 stop:8309 length:585 start_codon:yes stop_codon:yes gene_type:complete
MIKENIFKKLDELLSNEKSKGFLNHLIRSYFPEKKMDKVFMKPKGKFKCAITNESLISVGDILDGIQSEEFKENFFKHLHTMFDENSNVESPMAKLVGDRSLAVQGSKTDTFLSINTYRALHEWIITKVLLGDKHVSWLLKNINKKEFYKRGENIQNVEVQNVINKHLKKSDASATYALGDLPQLKALREKFDN